MILEHFVTFEQNFMNKQNETQFGILQKFAEHEDGKMSVLELNNLGNITLWAAAEFLTGVLAEKSTQLRVIGNEQRKSDMTASDVWATFKGTNLSSFVISTTNNSD